MTKIGGKWYYSYQNDEQLHEFSNTNVQMYLVTKRFETISSICAYPISVSEWKYAIDILNLKTSKLTIYQPAKTWPIVDVNSLPLLERPRFQESDQEVGEVYLSVLET